MGNLSKENKEVILDFYFRCGDEEHINCGRDLIASNPDAALLYSRLEDTLTQLDSIKYEPCPDNLAELTVARLKLAASSGQTNLENLLAIEQQKNAERESRQPVATTRRSFWRVLEIGAAAAMIALAIQMWVVSASNARHTAWQTVCMDNLWQIKSGLERYANDNEGLLPSTASIAGSPWWKVGYQGKENYSNTRNPWLLVKNGYAKGSIFICPGRKGAESLNGSSSQLAQLNDFPSRKNISYSYIYMCDRTGNRIRSGRMTVLMGDCNPLFERVFEKYDPTQTCNDEFDRILLDQRMKEVMSANHRGKGQNVLVSAGAAEFNKNRVYFNDDIYTVKGINVYAGCEVPCDENDTFLIP